MSEWKIKSDGDVAPIGETVSIRINFRSVPGDPLSAFDPESVLRVAIVRVDGQTEHVLLGYNDRSVGRLPLWTTLRSLTRTDDSAWGTFAVSSGDEVQILDGDQPTTDDRLYTVRAVSPEKIIFSGYPLAAEPDIIMANVRRPRPWNDPTTLGVLVYEDIECMVGDISQTGARRVDLGTLEFDWSVKADVPTGTYVAIAHYENSDESASTAVSPRFEVISNAPTITTSGEVVVSEDWKSILYRMLPTLYTDLGPDENVVKMTNAVARSIEKISALTQLYANANDPMTAHPAMLEHMATNLSWKLFGYNPQKWRQQLMSAVRLTKAKGTKPAMEEVLSLADVKVLNWEFYWKVWPTYTRTVNLCVDREWMTSEDGTEWEVPLGFESVVQSVHGSELDLNTDTTPATLAGSAVPPSPASTPKKEDHRLWSVKRRGPSPCLVRLRPGADVARMTWVDSNEAVYVDGDRGIISYRRRLIPKADDGAVKPVIRSLGDRYWLDKYYVEVIEGPYAGHYPILRMGADLGGAEYMLVAGVPDGLKGSMQEAQIVVRTRIFKGDTVGFSGTFIAVDGSRSSEAVFGDPDELLKLRKPEYFDPPQFETVFDGISGQGLTSSFGSIIKAVGSSLAWVGQEPTFEAAEPLEDASIREAVLEQMLVGGSIDDVDYEAFLAQPGKSIPNLGLREDDELLITCQSRPLPLVYYSVDDDGTVQEVDDPDNALILFRGADLYTESAILALDRADRRDSRSAEYVESGGTPPIDFDARLLPEHSEIVHDICSTLMPIAEPVIFGRVRTDVKWSTKPFNAEAYDGSMRDSKKPCDIADDFVENCNCQFSNYFSLEVAISELSDERIALTEEIINSWSPATAILHKLSAIGQLNDVVITGVEQSEQQILLSETDSVFDSAVYFDMSGLHGRSSDQFVNAVVAASGTASATNQGWFVFDHTLRDVDDAYSGNSNFDAMTLTVVSGPSSGTYPVEEVSGAVLIGSGTGTPATGDVEYELRYVFHRGTGQVTTQERHFVADIENKSFDIILGSEISYYTVRSGAQEGLAGIPTVPNSGEEWRLVGLPDSSAAADGVGPEERTVLQWTRYGIEVNDPFPDWVRSFQLVRDLNGTRETVSIGKGVPQSIWFGILTGQLDGIANFEENARDDDGRPMEQLFISENSVLIDDAFYSISRASAEEIELVGVSQDWSGDFYIGRTLHRSSVGFMYWQTSTLEASFDVEAAMLASIASSDPDRPTTTDGQEINDFFVRYDGAMHALLSASGTQIELDAPTSVQSGDLELVHMLPVNGKRFNMGGAKTVWRDAADVQGGEWTPNSRISPTEAGQISESIVITVEDGNLAPKTYVLE